MVCDAEYHNDLFEAEGISVDSPLVADVLDLTCPVLSFLVFSHIVIFPDAWPAIDHVAQNNK